MVYASVRARTSSYQFFLAFPLSGRYSQSDSYTAHTTPVRCFAMSHADRNLLFGILALQMDFISRDALIAAMHAWVLDKGKPLGQILVEQRALRGDAHALLEALVQKHLELHGNDPERSLA